MEGMEGKEANANVNPVPTASPPPKCQNYPLNALTYVTNHRTMPLTRKVVKRARRARQAAKARSTYQRPLQRGEEVFGINARNARKRVRALQRQSARASTRA